MNLIHRLWSWIALKCGYNRVNEFFLNGERMTMDELKERLKPPICVVCDNPIFTSAWGQVIKYHKYCKQFKNNKTGFDISKIYE